MLLHANPFVDWYLPLIERMPGYSFVRYTPPTRQMTSPFSMARSAAAAAPVRRTSAGTRPRPGSLRRHAGRLQLALDAPDLVYTLSLSSPPCRRRQPINPHRDTENPFAPIVKAHERGDMETAMERFLELVCGAGARTLLERAVPEAFAHGVQACDFFLRVEVPAILQYDFDTEHAERVRAPVLNVVGERSMSGFIDGAETVQRWTRTRSASWLHDATHFLMVEQTDAMAQLQLLRFFKSHPID